MDRVQWHWVACVVAGIGAAAHVYFAFIETVGWKLDAVRRIAPSWVDGVKDAEAGVAWAKPLAFNIGIYNLVLALGLAWTCRAFATRAPIASALGTFFAIWLLGAAAAALYTQVFNAVIAQGSLGVALLLASILARKQTAA
jgi:uncharacterized membrane protein